jgi:hypothetical protein
MGVNWLNIFKKNPKEAVSHTWDLVAKTYARPRLDIGILQLLNGTTLEKSLFGVTTTVWENELGEIRREEFLGSDETVLDDLLDKASQYGVQTIERGVNTFVVSKWVAPNSSTGNLPVRS